ncbi:MAG TPA: nicotinamide-nucleotide amidohydrolase family protein [Pseudolysinimonas sp.]|nr:nicotinamide-nucleotide amidohydrolase family protein [Pseudolysinimonas sp.]
MSAEQLLDELRRRGLTIAVAESLTGGLVVAELVAIPGASDVVRGGVVAYATDVKETVLKVDPELLAVSGPIHPEVARQMAAGVRHALGADIGVATTGVAGPDSQDGHSPGEVWIGVSTRNETVAHELRLSGDRNDIRQATVSACLRLVLASLSE